MKDDCCKRVKLISCICTSQFCMLCRVWFVWLVVCLWCHVTVNNIETGQRYSRRAAEELYRKLECMHWQWNPLETTLTLIHGQRLSRSKGTWRLQKNYTPENIALLHQMIAEFMRNSSRQPIHSINTNSSTPNKRRHEPICSCSSR